MLNSSLNIRSELLVPDNFTQFKGAKNKNMVQNETQTYSLRFGEKSESDKKNLKIFEEYGAKQANE